jgi:hypothetical protein
MLITYILYRTGNGGEDRDYRGGIVDEEEAMEDDGAMLGDEDQEAGSEDEGEGEDLIENMEA